jgi:metal-responsive CopG/Arc/MetJ family transcriptional regulator
MKTIYVALDARLLRATDRAARRANLSRSALIRNVLSEHWRTLAIHRLEAQDRKGYQLRPQGSKELSGWERAAMWPR